MVRYWLHDPRMYRHNNLERQATVHKLLARAIFRDQVILRVSKRQTATLVILAAFKFKCCQMSAFQGPHNVGQSHFAPFKSGFDQIAHSLPLEGCSE